MIYSPESSKYLAPKIILTMTTQPNFFDISNLCGKGFHRATLTTLLTIDAYFSHDLEAGRIDSTRWAPDSYCHYHRHLGETICLVIQGEHHQHCESPKETYTKVRRPGSVSCAPAGITTWKRRSGWFFALFSMQ